jgi:hypothetical protein
MSDRESKCTARGLTVVFMADPMGEEKLPRRWRMEADGLELVGGRVVSAHRSVEDAWEMS